jgi:hypothetical protein
MMGIGSFILFPICYGVIGFAFTVLAACLYNVLAGFMGRVEVELE